MKTPIKIMVSLAVVTGMVVLCCWCTGHRRSDYSYRATRRWWTYKPLESTPQPLLEPFCENRKVGELSGRFDRVRVSPRFVNWFLELGKTQFNWHNQTQARTRSSFLRGRLMFQLGRGVDYIVEISGSADWPKARAYPLP